MAYTARSATERGGSDVHAWRPGLPAPIRLTVDGRSVLGGWAGRLVAVSAIVRGDGPSGDAPVTAAATRTTLIDPATGIVVGDAIADAWRPSIDPLGRFAIFWEGSVHSTPDGGPWRPSRGRLVLAGFGLEPDPSPADRHRRGQRPTAVTPVVTDRTPLTDGTGAPAMWSVAWDAAGSTARVWITDDAGLSRLVTVVPAELSGAFRSLPIQHRFRR
jgi:hypothetical protein